MRGLNVPGRYGLALALAALAWFGSCTCGERPALRVTVRYQDFEPGCIQVVASDPAGPAAPPATLHVPPGSRNGELRVAVFRDPAWGPTLRVQVEARELDCQGPVVTSELQDTLAPEDQTQTLTFIVSAADVDGDRYVASPPGRDCADDDPIRYPGAPELCDGLDQNCVLGPDDGLGVGAACSDLSGCTGIIECQADGGAGCSFISGLHPDQDRDGAGAAGPAICAAADSGYVTNQDDCDDGDPFSARGLAEICDRRDNDCDGRVDLSADGGSPCPASPAWVDYSPGGGNHDWHSVWTWADGGVWIASVMDNHTSQKLPQDALFTAQDCAITAVWRGVWADSRTGVAYVVGDGAKMMVNRGAAGCTDRSSIAGTPSEPRAVMGFQTDAGVELYVIGGLGDTARWDGGAGVQALDQAAPRLIDIHGTSPATMFAAGFSQSPVVPQISRFAPPRGWTPQVLPPSLATSGDFAQGVHVVGKRLAYAVTSGGRVLRWDGQSWELHPAPDGGSLVAVLAFGTSSVFALSASTLWEWDGGSWGPILGPSAELLFDLHGTNPADIWVVGDNGTVFRWPQ